MTNISFEQLYYKQPYTKSLHTVITKVVEYRDSVALITEATVFYPEGGGQAGDKGWAKLSDERFIIADTQSKQGEVVHILAKEDGEALKKYGMERIINQEVELILDWDKRYDLMQQHTAEHIFSGFANQLFGANNVGFHLNYNQMILDFDKFISDEELAKIEALSNETVWQNIAVEDRVYKGEEAAGLSFRSKKVLNSDIRLVKIKGADQCACCGVHVGHTGEIGVIKIIDSEKHKNGTRVYLLAGRRAWADYVKKNEIVARLRKEYSAQVEDLFEKIKRRENEQINTKQKLLNCQSKYWNERARTLVDKEKDLAFHLQVLADADRDEAKIVLNAFLENGVGTCAVLMPIAPDNFAYTIAGDKMNLQILQKDLQTVFKVKGGGRKDFIQGSINGSLQDLQEFFATIKSRS